MDTSGTAHSYENYKAYRFVICAVIVTVIASVSASHAQGAECTESKYSAPRFAEAIGIVHDDSLDAEVIEEAIATWQRCSGYGTGFPELLLGDQGVDRTLFVKHERISRESGTRQRCGQLVRDTITLFSYARNPQGRFVTCGSLARNLAHELGHALGLRDSPSELACSYFIMATIDRRNVHRRRVMDEECRAVAQSWLTSG